MSKLETINVDCRDFVTRTITIFGGTEQEQTIKVATTALLDFLEINETSEDLLNPDYLSLDNQISCYVEPMQLLKMSEEELIKYVEENYYD